jgi:transcriptional regulator with XRE-family HTH domain
VTHDVADTPAAIFGRNLKRLRSEAGLSQEELASRSGLHRTYVSSVERGNRNVSLENIFALAAALKCDPRELLAPPPGDEEGV